MLNKKSIELFIASISGLNSTPLDTATLLSFILPGKRKQALELANKLLSTFGNLRQIATRSIEDLSNIKGITKETAAYIKMIFELVKRFSIIQFVPGEFIESSSSLFQYYHEKLRDDKQEKFIIVLLNCKHRIIREELISLGSLNASIVHPREVFAAAIKAAAESIILIHNHPSGDPTPSKEDIAITQKLVNVGKIVGIEILDHLIIGNGSYISFCEQGLLHQI